MKRKRRKTTKRRRPISRRRGKMSMNECRCNKNGMKYCRTYKGVRITGKCSA